MTVTSVSPAYGLLQIVKTAEILGAYVGAVSKLTDTPDAQVAFLDRGGKPPLASIAIDYPAVQIIVRGAPNDYNGAYTMAQAVRDALLGIPDGGINYPNLTSVTGIGHLLPLGYDEKNRPQISFSLQLIVSYETSGFRD